MCRAAAMFAVCLAPAIAGAQGFGTNGSSVVSRTTKAINYRKTSGSTKIIFRGTELMQQASGEAKVENKNGRIGIEAKFEGFEDATKFGLEYLTYVLWAISPQGRAVNLGELELKNGAGRVKAITELQTFGMVVTAEPYFGVTQPGNMVVLENDPAQGGSRQVRRVCARQSRSAAQRRRGRVPPEARPQDCGIRRARDRADRRRSPRHGRKTKSRRRSQRQSRRGQTRRRRPRSPSPRRRASRIPAPSGSRATPPRRGSRQS